MKTVFLAATALVLAVNVSYAKLSVEKGPLKKISKVALVTVSIDNIGSGSAADAKFLSDAAAFALSNYEPGLKALGKWEMVPAPAVSELETAMAGFETSPVTLNALEKLANQNKLPGKFDQKDMMALAMASMTGKKGDLAAMKGKMIAASAKELNGQLSAMRKGMVWAEGTSGLPYGLLIKRKDLAPGEEAIRDILDQVLRDYCARNGLDAVALVHLKSVTGQPGDIRVIVAGNRILSSLKVNPGIVVRGKDGEIAVDSGQPRLDDLAPMKLAMPIFVGEKQAGGNWANFKLDLDDPAGKARAAYNELIKDTAADLLKDLGKKLK